MEKSVQLAALQWKFVPPTFTDYRAPLTGLVGQLAARWPQVAFTRRLPMDWASSMIGLVGQLAARRPQVAFPGRLLVDWPFNDQLPFLTTK